MNKGGRACNKNQLSFQFKNTPGNHSPILNSTTNKVYDFGKYYKSSENSKRTLIINKLVSCAKKLNW